MKYFIYVRKSTDVEDKQVLSVEAQVVELKEYAAKYKLDIVDIFIEKRTAKKPGRPILNKMLSRISSGEANGILSWLPDRLSRNSIDSGQIIYMLDENILLDLKFPHFWFENTPQGKYMLANEFNSSKQYVDNLSVNTKRGLRQKVRRGEMPGVAPIGYYNDMRTKTAKIDKKTAPIVKQAFELYAKGDKRLDEIADFMYANGIQTKSGQLYGKKTTGKKPYHKNRIKRILTNPFYYGHFRYLGEVYEGKHTPLISKRLFDDVQTVLEKRGRPQKAVKEPQPLCGLVHCSCGMMFTNERQIKRQKNGNVHIYDYYRCTRKNKSVDCKEPHIRAEELDKQLSSLLLDFAMPIKWADKLYELIRRDELNEKSTLDVEMNGIREQIVQLSSKLQRLLDSYLDGYVERELYQNKRAEILGDKKRLQEQIEQASLGVLTWVEPMNRWLERAVSICKIAESDDLPAKKSLLLEIFGSNLKMQNKNVVVNDDQFLHSPQENIWVWLRQSLEKIAHSGDNFQFCSDLVRVRRL
ncbi:MAG TPA: recombinase family protein [Candidatus Saccharibacteria bacterium]|nr:recombinase family protein [Candidatus Saccharibacteria bacterium]